MTDADRMLVAACKTPADATVRSAAADAVREWGDPMLAHAIEDDDTGPRLLKAIALLGDLYGLPVSLNLAWAQFHVVHRLMTTGTVATGISAEEAQQIAEAVMNAPLRSNIVSLPSRPVNWISPEEYRAHFAPHLQPDTDSTGCTKTRTD